MSAHPLAQPLAEGVAALGLELTVSQQTQLLAYLDLLARWNKVYNLTALRQPAEMLTHHLLDSLAVITPLRRYMQTMQTGTNQGSAVRLLDVGSGAGLPGAVIAMTCADVQVSCVDTVAKKTAFIQQVASTLGLSNLHGIHARVERLHGPFDIISARAFATLADFSNLSAQALAGQGVWMAMKGKRPDDEMAALPSSVQVFHVEPLSVPGLNAQRCLVWMRPRLASDMHRAEPGAGA